MTLHPGNKYLENRSCPYTHTVKEGIFVAVYSGCEHWMKLLKMKKRMSCGQHVASLQIYLLHLYQLPKLAK